MKKKDSYFYAYDPSGKSDNRLFLFPHFDPIGVFNDSDGRKLVVKEKDEYIQHCNTPKCHYFCP